MNVLPALAAALGGGLAVFVVTWLIGLRIGRHRIVDIAWGFAFATMALISAGLAWSDASGIHAGRQHLRILLVTALVVLWGLRLGGFIFWRNLSEKHEDPRYVDILAQGTGDPRWYALRMVYLLQAAIAWFVLWPVVVAQHNDGPFGLLTWIGVIVWAVGLYFEAVGDAQLAAFKADPARRGTVLDTGLWRYTRHPNYFGDTAVWWGLWLIAASTWWGVATLPSVLVMTYFLTLKTGKPLTEEHMGRRPGYADYVARTSGFFPWPPKAGPAKSPSTGTPTHTPSATTSGEGP